MKIFKLDVFGSFQLSVEGQPITQFRTYKIRDLLIYLTVNANFPHHRDHLAALLWSDYPDKVARTNLRNALAQLRKILAPVLAEDPAFLSTSRQVIQLNLNPQTYVTDVQTIERLLTTYQDHNHQDALLCDVCLDQLTQIGTLYRGEFLSGLNQTGDTLFDEWRLQQQEHYHQQMTYVYSTLTQYHFDKRNYAQAELFARYQLGLEPWREEAHQKLMQSLALNGQRAAALTQYEICCQILVKELKVSPSSQTERLYEQIRTENITRDTVDQANEGARFSALAGRPNAVISINLPPMMTPFFGREVELAQLNQLLLDPTYRLVTLVGQGGIGKTRLALAVAEQASSYFADGVWFVPLAGLSSDPTQDGEAVEPISTENSIVTAIAEALKLTFYESTPPMAQLFAHLRQRNYLLILDNFEHLLGGINFVVEMLKQVSNVSLLVTSREQINLQAEYVLQIDGLPVPSLENELKISNDGQIQSYSSVQLFVERADRTRRGFALNNDNHRYVTRICSFLNGLPLAIELAATWVKAMTCADIAQAMERDLDFLATSKRDVPTRHRSMRAVFEYSWQLLSEQEQVVLSQLSIFRGDFAQDAAKHVAKASPMILATLVDKSLVQLVMPGRYQLHELLRQFAVEKLAQLACQPNLSDRLSRTEAKYGRYYLNFIRQKEAALNGHQARTALAEIRHEITNIRHAWHSVVTHFQIELIERCIEVLSNYYYLMGLFEEGIAICDLAANRLRSLDSLTGREKLVLGNLLIRQAMFYCAQTKADQAIFTAKLALDLGQTIESNMLIAGGHLWQGHALWHQGKFDAARDQFFQSLGYAQGHIPQMEAQNLSGLSNVYFDQGEYIQSLTYNQQALQLHRELKNVRNEAGMLGNLGHVTAYLGNYAQAKVYQEQALQIRNEIGDLSGQAISLEAFGNLYYRLEDFELAQQYLEEALHIYEQIEDSEGIGYALTYLGNIWLGRGELETARQLYNQALHVRQTAGQFHLVSEDQAGLAQIALMDGNLDQAQLQVESILDYLERESLKGEDLFRVYLTCYRVLKANQDPRAQKIINMAYQHLQTQAEKIDDDGLRQSFLENVTLHREVVNEWQFEILS